MTTFLPLSESKDLGRHLGLPETAARYRLNDLYSAVWLSEAVGAAIRINLPEAITNDWITSDHIAKQKSLQPDALYRLMRALAANGIFEETEGRLFRHTPLSRQLQADHPYSYRPMARLWTDPMVRRSWEHLPETLANSDSGIKNASGHSLYEALQADEELAHVFNDAMISNSAHASVGIARALDLADAERVIDLGGGVGTLIAAIVKVHPHLHGTLFELPYLEEAALQYLRTKKVDGKVDFIAGNFFEAVPDGFDCYLIKNTAWNFGDEQTLQIMRGVRKAIGSSSARFAVIEYVIQESNMPWTTLFDLQMMNLPGGRARTIAEYTAMFESSEFRVERMIGVEDQTILIASPV